MPIISSGVKTDVHTSLQPPSLQCRAVAIARSITVTYNVINVTQQKAKKVKEPGRLSDGM